MDAINCMIQKDFSSAWKIFKEQIKYFEDGEELRKFTSLRDIADYCLVLNLMCCGRNELLNVIASYYLLLIKFLKRIYMMELTRKFLYLAMKLLKLLKHFKILILKLF